MSENTLPPSRHTVLWQEITAAADKNEFRLQVCQQCKTVQYPPRELCKNCLADQLVWEEVSPVGTLQSWTRLHTSGNDFFRDNLPWLIGLVKLQCGPRLFVHLTETCRETGQAVRLVNKQDKSGQAVFIAIPENGDVSVDDEKVNRLLPDS